MSLFAGTGFFTQSAVLFPTSIEKNKKTEACSRDPQASSLLHGKGRHRRPFFTRGGGKPFWGVGGWAAGCKIAPQACTCHANPPGTIVPVPTRGLAAPGGPGQDAGAALPKGVRLVPEGTPKAGPCGAAPVPSLPTPLFGSLAPAPFGEGTCFDLPIFPPVHLWQRGLASRQRPLATCGVEARTGRVQRSLGNTDPKLLGLSGRLRVQSA